MTTYSAVLPTFAATTAGLKDAMNSVGTLMTNAGWANSSDTGQVDINSVVYSGTSGTLYGYKVWYFNDSQHSTYPIYLRMYWRMNASSQLGIAFTIGHATDGAGNITGYKNGSDTTFMGSGATTAWGTAANASKACTIDGYSFWSLAPQATVGNGGPMLWLSREWDNTTGAIKTNGNYTFCYYSSGVTAPVWLNVNRAQSTAISSGYASFAPYQQANSQAGGTTDVFRVYTAFPEFGINGSGLTYHASEIGAWTTFSAQPLTGGSARTFTATGLPRFANGGVSPNSDALAVIWE